MAVRKSRMCSVSGFWTSGVIADKGVRELLATLPAGHTRPPALSSLRYVDSIKYDAPRRHRRFPGQQIFGEWSINTETGRGDAIIYRQHAKGNPIEFDFIRTVLHEVGHAVHHRLASTNRRTWATIHDELVIIMNEQSRIPDEHFCYQYAGYVLRPTAIRGGFSDVYSFLRDHVFQGKEY